MAEPFIRFYRVPGDGVIAVNLSNANADGTFPGIKTIRVATADRFALKRPATVNVELSRLEQVGYEIDRNRAITLDGCVYACAMLRWIRPAQEQAA